MFKKPIKYRGALAKPINLQKLDIFKGISKNVSDEIIERLRLLINHYGIDVTLSPEQIIWELALSLAFEHVPGFQITQQQYRGAKRKWTLEECRALIAAVDAQKTTKGIKVAIKRAMRQKDWRW